MRIRSAHSRRTVPTQRSAKAFTRGKPPRDYFDIDEPGVEQRPNEALILLPKGAELGDAQILLPASCHRYPRPGWKSSRRA
jgi:hypothetical protein